MLFKRVFTQGSIITFELIMVDPSLVTVARQAVIGCHVIKKGLPLTTLIRGGYERQGPGYRSEFLAALVILFSRTQKGRICHKLQGLN